MIDRIIQNIQFCAWDFTKYAFDDDPMSGKFEEWKEIYKIKYSIASVLYPENLLEIGVRYGYSASSFLQAVPSCKYLGIDSNQNDSGGVAGSLNWAEQNLKNRFQDVKFIEANTQEMSDLPGDHIWDLIHVDGKQDGSGMENDLTLAIKKSKWILVDGYWWTEHNFKSINNWLRINREKISYHAVINDRASNYGDVLVRTRI